MKIKPTLNLITIIPITLLIGLSLVFSINYFNQYKNIKNDTYNLQKIEILKDFLIQLSKERQYAILQLKSNTNETTFEFKKNASKTNTLVNNIVNLYNQNKKDDKIYQILKSTKKIVNLREDIISKDIDYKEIFKNYDILNNDILSKLDSISLNFSSNHKNLKKLLKIVTLIKNVSDERDFIANIYSNNQDIEDLYKIKLFKNSNIISNQNIQDFKIKSILSITIKDKNFFNILKETKKIREDLLTKGYVSNYSLKRWEELEDKKLSYLIAATDKIKSEILQNLKDLQNITLLKFLLSSLLLVFSIFLLYRYFKVKSFLFNYTPLELILKKALSLSKLDKEIDLDSFEGINKSYQLIDSALDKIELEKKKAENDNASKTIFLANMSHEIRTPINGIVGFTDLLKKSNLSKTQKEYIDIISKSTDNLLEIINSILDLSKIESKKIEIDAITFSPIEEFESSVELFIAKAAKKDINLNLYMLPEFENYLIGDSLKLKEVLLNLISNAIKFTPNGGEVNVTIKKLPSSNQNSQKIYFEVSDNGIGMSEDELSEVFDAFRQADSTITRKYGGTGLGLTISSNYVSLMGGELKAKSKKNKGTKFFFTLEFKKSHPLKLNEYKNSFEKITPLIITDPNNLEFAKYFKEYLSYFTKNPSYIEASQIEQNISLFDRANLIVVTQEVYNQNNFSYLQRTNKKLLILKRTKEYLNQKNHNSFIFYLSTPITFFKTVEILQSTKPTKQNKSLIYDESKPKVKHHNILIAEDNNINLKLIEEFFKQYKNITLKKALNGEEAVSLYMQNSFDLILMDIAMPVLDGISATKKILEYESINSIPHTPIIALTANALKGDKEKFLSEGMDEYITKPIKEDDLLKVLKKFSIELAKDSNNINIKTKDMQEDKKEKRQILIYKKSEVETKIFHKVLSQSYSRVDFAINSSDFFKLLKEFEYDAILLDKEINDIDFENLKDLKKEHPETALILFRNFETFVSNKLRRFFDEIIINSSDSAYLKTILSSYIKEKESIKEA